MIVQPRFGDTDVVALGVDPGEEHVGLALAHRYLAAPEEPGQTTPRLLAPGWRVYATAEMGPAEFVRWFRRNASRIDLLIAEMFYLDPGRARMLSGSPMPTSQIIGWLDIFCATEAPHIDTTWQSNQVLTGPVAALLRMGGIRPVSPPGANKAKGSTGDHQRSAELHLWHGLIRAGLVEGIQDPGGPPGDRRGLRWNQALRVGLVAGDRA